MDFVAFVYIYFGFTAVVVFVLLFGDAPAFAGTPVAWLKWLVAEAWIDVLEWSVNTAFGNKGLKTLDRATEFCCESSNPTLQVAYLVLYASGYGLYWQYVFKLLPNDYASEYHIYAGTAAVCLTLTTFVIASMSHPGRITQQNSAIYLAAYPCDDALFPTKECSTCKISRPGRSKHCNICKSCIPRFDHHCGWINNCVGLHNMRIFLAFLMANCGTCAYGVLLAAAAVAGSMKKRGYFDVYIYDPDLQYRVPLYSRPARLAEWVLVYYPIPVAVGMFMAVAGLLMLAFILYQAYMISEGYTSYETYKRNQLCKRLRAAATQQQQSSSSIGWLTSLARWRHRRPVVEVYIPPNCYDKGFRGNWCEVLCPGLFLQQFQRQLQREPTASAAKKQI